MSTHTIQSGDTFSSIASKNNITAEGLERANPGVNPNNLQIGQIIQLGGNKTMYTIKEGDTLSVIAALHNISVSILEAANPTLIATNLQIGTQIVIPARSAAPTVPDTLPAPAPAPIPSSRNTYTIKQGDTFTAIANQLNMTVEAIEVANPGVNPNNLQIGQVINLPGNSVPEAQVGAGGSPGSEVGHAYKAYQGPSSAYPHPSLWASYDTLWSQNSVLMKYNSSPQQVDLINEAVHSAAWETGLDPRAILCIIMQESGGNVHVGTTFNGVVNTGIMQAFNGISFNPNDERGSIFQMVRDGAGGSANGPGLKQAFEGNGGDYYVAFRVYNSGSVNWGDLNDPRGATGKYVEDMANRLMGHVWMNM